MLQLKCGDCLELLKTLPDKSIDLVLTDPPYGTTSCKWDTVIPFDLMWNELNRVTKDNGAILLFGSEPFASALRMSNIKNYKYDWVWNKNSGGNVLSLKSQPLKVCENIIVFGGKGKINYYPIKEQLDKIRNEKPKVRVSDGIYASNKSFVLNNNKITHRHPKNLLNFSAQSKECNNTHRIHPTQKPVKLLEYLIKTYTKEQDTILDFTMGSGSTGVACVNTNRSFIGFELDNNYYDIAVKRVNNA